MKKILASVIAMVMLLTSCSQNDTSFGGLKSTVSKEKEDRQASIWVEGDTYPLTVHDYLGNEITLKEDNTDMAAVLSGTPLNIWYDLGGKSICSSQISKNVKLVEGYEDEMLALPEIGPVYSIDMEAVMEHNPKLIIAQVGTQTTQASKLSQMGYDVIQTNIVTFNDVIDTYRAFGKILGKSELAEEKIKKLIEGKEEITNKLPDKETKIAILYVTSGSLAVKLDNSISGDAAKILNLKNIASNLPPDTIGSQTTPLDIEYLVEQDPDYLLVTTMISSNEEAKKVVEEHFNTNDAWKSVRAVQENKIVYLPQEYFLYNAGPYFNEGLEFIAKSIYPDIYGEIK